MRPQPCRSAEGRAGRWAPLAAAPPPNPGPWELTPALSPGLREALPHLPADPCLPGQRGSARVPQRRRGGARGGAELPAARGGPAAAAEGGRGGGQGADGVGGTAGLGTWGMGQVCVSVGVGRASGLGDPGPGGDRASPWGSPPAPVLQPPAVSSLADRWRGARGLRADKRLELEGEDAAHRSAQRHLCQPRGGQGDLPLHGERSRLAGLGLIRTLPTCSSPTDGWVFCCSLGTLKNCLAQTKI